MVKAEATPAEGAPNRRLKLDCGSLRSLSVFSVLRGDKSAENHFHHGDTENTETPGRKNRTLPNPADA